MVERVLSVKEIEEILWEAKETKPEFCTEPCKLRIKKLAKKFYDRYERKLNEKIHS